MTSVRAKGPHAILSLILVWVSISRCAWGIVGAFLFLCDVHSMQYECLLYLKKKRRGSNVNIVLSCLRVASISTNSKDLNF